MKANGRLPQEERQEEMQKSVSVKMTVEEWQTVLMAVSTGPQSTWDLSPQVEETVLDALSEKTRLKSILY